LSYDIIHHFSPKHVMNIRVKCFEPSLSRGRVYTRS